MELKIEYVPTKMLIPYENNTKIHTVDQIRQIKDSIKAWGFNDPIALWKDNIVIEGHGRLIAATELGMKTVPIIRLDSLSDSERRAYTLVHNKLTMNTGFDTSALEQELQALKDIDMSQFGFDMPEINLDDILTPEPDHEPVEPEMIQCPHCGAWFSWIKGE